MSGIDHGELNLPLHKRGGGSLDAQIDREMAKQRAAAREEWRRLREVAAARREAENARPKLTADDIRGAAVVRDEYGWHKVVRVSAKSVTVETDYSWTDRIPLDRILEARAA